MGAATLVATIPFLFFVSLPNRASLPMLVLSALLQVAYVQCLAFAYRKGELGTAYPIARGTSPLLVTLGAWFLAKETPAPRTLLGIGVVCVGILALASDRRRVDRTTVLASLATGCFIAAYTVTDGIGIRLAGDSLAYNVWLFAAFGLGMTLTAFAQRGIQGWKGEPRRILTACAGGMMSMVAYGLVVTAMRQGAMGHVSALRETSVVLAVLIGRFFLGEPLSPRRVGACLAVAAGVLLASQGA